MEGRNILLISSKLFAFYSLLEYTEAEKKKKYTGSLVSGNQLVEKLLKYWLPATVLSSVWLKVMSFPMIDM